MNSKLKHGYLIPLLVCITVSMVGQNAHKNLLNGDMLYGFGKYAEAEKEYRKADNADPGLKSSYNLGNSLMNQDKYDEAIKKYREASDKSINPQDKAAALHNLGNAYYKKKQYKESVDAFKKSLAANPDDLATKENLAIARRELQKQMKQQQQQKGQQNQDQQNQDENSDKDQQQNQDKNQNNQQGSQDKNKQKNAEGSKQEMTREDARKLLDFINDRDRKVGKNQRKQEQPAGKERGKDW